MDDNRAIGEMLMELEYIGFTPKQAQDLVMLKHFVLSGDYTDDMQAFTAKEVNRMLFVNWLVRTGKLEV